METLVIYTPEEAVELPLPFPAELEETNFIKGLGVHISTENGITKVNGIPVSLNALTDITEGIKAAITTDNTETYSTRNKDPLRIGNYDGDHIHPAHGDAQLALYPDRISVLDGADLYIGGKKAEPGGEYPMKYGHCIWAGAVKITPHKTYVEISGGECGARLGPAIDVPEKYPEFPIYKRSPRIIKREPTGTVEMKTPEKKDGQKGGLVKLIIPPLAMTAVTVGMGMIMGRGMMMLITAAATLMSTVFSVTTYINERKERAEKEEKRTAAYEDYLLRQRKKLHALETAQRESAHYHNMSPERILTAIKMYSDRLYERSPGDSDFLTLSLGLYTAGATYTVKETGGENDDDPMAIDMREIADSFRRLEKMPSVTDLKNAHLGLVGEKIYAHRVINHILLQLCFYQSYHDMEIMIFTEEEDRPKFEWARWFPHMKIKSINISGLVSGENERDQVLGNIAQILKARRQKQEESKKDDRYLPHYVFIVDNPKLVINHSIMEHIQSPGTALGFSLIYTTNIMANLPENIRTVLRLDGGRYGTLIMDGGNLMMRDIELYGADESLLPRAARILAPISHRQGVSTQIPDSITFFELYNIKSPSEIPVLSLWEKNACHKSLAVPLGVRGKDDTVYLNLHEKAHGPHGLVAGTTGSGKSEIVQSYILSLAVNFHPHEVGFLLIDYKGGGMANLFKELPHLLGTITNLDGSESMRALASIKSELRRRQQMFTDSGVNSINQYTKKFRAGEVTEPMPHLFIISDEFAELKKEQPGFMSELVSAARIGRSLGVHLILATQKPSGVVDDQIWSNSKFKLALKVADERDSNEILKTPDAARITQPGRAYLQVGNNEIYELFQSAFSGAPYSEDTVEKGFDDRVYILNRLGQGELLNEDLSDTGGETDSKLTQLDAVVLHIKETYRKLNATEVAKPWLPPLPEKLVNPHIQADKDVGLITEYNVSVPLGLCDIPERQSQEEYAHDFLADGNLAVFGASGCGKSVTLMNMALSMAAANSPKYLNYYVLDYGNSTLIPLKGLPHTADYLTFDDGEKLDKLKKLLTEQIKRRKNLFARTGSINFRMYNEIASESDNKDTPRIPVIILFLDNYDVIKETGDDTEPFLAKLTRDGVGVGIYTVVTSSRPNGIRYAVSNNFKNKVVYHLNDASELTATAGRSDYKLPDNVSGRAFVKMKGVNIMQGYLPAVYEDDMDYIKRIGGIVKGISEKNTAGSAEGIPVLPEILSYKDLTPYIKPDTKEAVVGLDTETTKPVYMNLNNPINLIGGMPQTGRTNVLKIILSQFEESMCYVFDSKSGDLEGISEKANVRYAADAEGALVLLGEVEKKVQIRKTEVTLLKGDMRIKDFTSKMASILIIIDDLESFVEFTKPKAAYTETTLKGAMEWGMSLIISGRGNGMDFLSKGMKGITGIVLGKPGDQSLIAMSVTPLKYTPIPNIGLNVLKRVTIGNVKIPFIGETSDDVGK